MIKLDCSMRVRMPTRRQIKISGRSVIQVTERPEMSQFRDAEWLVLSPGYPMARDSSCAVGRIQTSFAEIDPFPINAV